MGGHVIYVKKEEEGAKNSALWDSRAHVYLTRLAPFYQHFLCSIGQKMFNPEVGAGSNCRCNCLRLKILRIVYMSLIT